MKYALALLFLLISTVAISQGCGPSNPGCIVPTAPPGTNNNQAASTAFVQGAVGPGTNAITQITGDVAAGPGPGSVSSTIQPGVVTNAKMAAGAAAANVGSLGGDLTGTLPSPTIAANAVTNAKMAAGAAAANVGTLGGDLNGSTLPNPTVSAGAITSAKMATGAAAANVGTLGGVLGGTLPNPTMAAGAAATNVGSLGGSLTGTLPNPTIANSAVTNARLANEAALTVKCNATGSAAAPTDCTPDQVANNLGYCVIDGQTFAATTAGLQSAINTTSCHDIYVPPGTFSGTAQVQVARSNIRIRGAGGVTSAQTFSSGTQASTILSFSCFNPGANPGFLIGDASATLTYGGIEVTDLQIVYPATCNMIGLQINTSSTDVTNSIRRVRISQAAGTASGTGVFLGNNVYNWLFDNDVVDHFSNCYRLSGVNNETKIRNGQIADCVIGVNHQNSAANTSSNVVIDSVDFENHTTTAIDLGSTNNIIIQNCWFGVTTSAGARAIRLGNVASQVPTGVSIVGNLFNAGGTSADAIELDAAGGFSGLNIQRNQFVGFTTNNVLNNVTTTGSGGVYIENTKTNAATDLSATNGFTATLLGSLLSLGSVNGGNGQLTLNGNVSGGYTIGSAGTGVPTMTTPWPIAAGGTGDTGTAWATYSPAPSCGTATFSGTAGRFKTLGKTVFVSVATTIATLGTCAAATPLTITLPVATQGGFMIIVGAENGNSGNMVQCTTAALGSGTTAQCFKGGNFGTAWAAADLPMINGSYESQ